MNGRSELKGVAYNIAHQFSFSAVHYARMAYERGISTVEIDLLAGVITPVAFDIRRNRILAERCQSTLNDITTSSLNRPLQAAQLVLTMGDDTRDDPARVTVTLADELGRRWGGDRSVVLWRSGVCHGSGHFFHPCQSR